MLRAGGGQLHLSATDMEISLRVSLDARFICKGSFDWRSFVTSHHS